MKRLGIFVAGFALSSLSLLPATAMANDDELDVTMEVLDSVADIDGQVLVIPEPEDDRLEGADNEGEGVEHDGEMDARENDGIDSGSDRVDDFAGEGSDDNFANDDDFAHDDDFESDEDEEHSEDESDFDEGDEIDNDEPEEDEPMHDDELGGPEDGDSASEDDLIDDVADAGMDDGEVTDIG